MEKTSEVTVPHQENLETNELKDYRKHFKNKETPFEQHIVLIDRQCDSKEIFRIFTATKNRTTLSRIGRQWPFSDWLVEATYNTGGREIFTGITVTRSGIDLDIDINATGLDFRKSTVSVTIAVKTLKGEYTGDASFTPNVFIAVGKKRSDESKSKTVVHEIGHALGLVPSTDHDYHDDNRNGGSGNHCRFGATPDKKSMAQGGTCTDTYTGGSCVMFAYSSEKYEFCDTCKEFVKEASLYNSNMKSRGWG